MAVRNDVEYVLAVSGSCAALVHEESERRVLMAEVLSVAAYVRGIEPEIIT
jgi:hypothetical protein